MCLAIPRKVIEINEDNLVVECGKNKINVKSLLNIKKGDYVLVQGKIIVDKIPKEKAENFLEMLK